MKKLIIAIDGFSGCGKSTIAKDLSQALNYIFIDSGAMYRGVTLFALRNQWIDEEHFDASALTKHLDQINLQFSLPEITNGAQHLMLNGENVEEEIRSLRVSNFVSLVAALSPVRKKLVEAQRLIGILGGVVMDGRDIGSVVFPDADLKFFVTAQPIIRARRRQAELEKKGEFHDLDEILKNLESRDAMDTSRSDSPLIQTQDAILVDTSNMTRASQLEFVLQYAREKQR